MYWHSFWRIYLGEPSERLVTFKRWLWAVIEKMSPLEKQDLVYFWTGEITCIFASYQHCLYQRFSCSSCKWRRVPANAKCDHQTCGRQSSSISQHLHLKTLYSSLFQVDKTHDNFIHWQASFFSKQILKAKLLLAIKTKNFGFVWKSVYYSESWKSCEGCLFISKPKPVNNYVNFVKADLPS